MNEAGGQERALQFEVKLGERPKVLAGIAGLMCCTEDEALAVRRAMMTFGGCVMDEEEEDTEDAVAVVDMSGRLKVRLCQESRRRTGRYVAFILDRVEPMACGEGGESSGGESPAPGGVDDANWSAALRVRAGAREVFRATNAMLENDALLTDGGWIDDAVASILNIY
jgi:hypothetical protein